VLWMNHAAQAHWVGSRSADFIVNHDRASRDFAEDRRGVHPSRMVHLPIPVTPHVVSVDERSAARSQAGVEPNQTMLFTSGPSSKFRSIEDGVPGLLELVTPVLRQHRDAVLVAVGPGADPIWEAAADVCPDQIRTFPLGDAAARIAPGADVHLDPFPFSSSTAALEAAGRGTPVLVFDRYDGLARILASGIQHVGFRHPTPESYQAALSQLIESPQMRRDVGEKGRAHVVVEHSGPGWRQHLRDLIDTVRSELPDGPSVSEVMPRFDEIDQLVGAYQCQRWLTREAYKRDMNAFRPPLDAELALPAISTT
jgi:glycosyltransferase involved in cell wall biosynthesis